MTSRCWIIEVRGFPPYALVAATRSSARYRAYRQYVDGWADIPFLDFARMCRVSAG